MKRLLGAFFAFALLSVPLTAEACSIHDHGCRFHGTGRPVIPDGLNLSNTGLAVDLTWQQNVDVDLHGQLPPGAGPYIPQGSGRIGATDRGTFRTGEPFTNGTTHTNNPRHVFYNQHRIDFQNNTAAAEISGDVLGDRTNPNPICQHPSGNNCERIQVEGNLPEGRYQFQGYNFNYTEEASPTANYQIDVYTGDSIVATINDTHTSTFFGQLTETGDKTQLVNVDIRNRDFEPHAVGVSLLDTSRYMPDAYRVQNQHRVGSGTLTTSYQQPVDATTVFDAAELAVPAAEAELFYRQRLNSANRSLAAYLDDVRGWKMLNVEGARLAGMSLATRGLGFVEPVYYTAKSVLDGSNEEKAEAAASFTGAGIATVVGTGAMALAVGFTSPVSVPVGVFAIGVGATATYFVGRAYNETRYDYVRDAALDFIQDN